jgi:replicative superfamily II helicase
MVGINMPVRTVVLLQDYHLLNGINYRQIIGRAGRRGHDKLGYIVFYGFTRQRMRELHIRSLQVIQTSSSLDITTVLKVMILEHASYEKFDRKKTTERLLRLLHPPLNSANEQKSEVSDRLENERFFKVPKVQFQV